MKHYLNQKSSTQSVLASSGTEGGGYMEDIIKEIGLALSQSQEKLDELLIESQQLRLQEIVTNPQLILPEPSAFVLPEAKLDLNMSIKGKTDSSNNFKIETKPHNAKNQAQSNVNQEVTSKISLKFAMVPEEGIDQGKPNKQPSRQSPETIHQSAISEIEDYNEKKTSKPKIIFNQFTQEYVQDSRKWYVGAWDGNQLFALLIFDDTTGDFVDLLFLSPGHRKIEDIAELSSPLIHSVDKLTVEAGEIVAIKGENLGALNMDDTIVRIGNKQVDPLEVSVEKIAIKITPDLVSGPVSVTVKNYTSEYEKRLVIVAAPLRFVGDTNYGYYNPANKQGSLIKIAGRNISGQTKLQFANGTIAMPVSHASQLAQFRVPPGASSGPVSFLTGSEEIKLSSQSFYIRPLIREVSPKEAPYKSLVRITGNHFTNVTRLKIGEQCFELDDNAEDAIFFIRSKASLLFAVPENAGDGWIYLESQGAWWKSNAFFYQVPSVFRAPDYLITGVEHEIFGHGFGKQAQGLYVEFQQQKQTVEASYLKPTESNSQSLGFKLSKPYYTDKLRIVRADIASDEQYEKTTAAWNRKVPIFKAGTQRDQIIWCSPTWEGIDKNWRYEGMELLATNVLKKAQDDGALIFEHETKKIDKYFTFYGEFYQLESLSIEVGPPTAALELTVTNSYLNMTFPVSGVSTESREEFDQEESLTKLLFKISHTNEGLFIGINGQSFEYRLSDPSVPSVASEAIGNFSQSDEYFDMKVIPSNGSYVNSIIISQLDALLLPDFSEHPWDFELSELEPKEEGYQLYPLEKYPNAQTRTLTLKGSGFTENTSVMLNNVQFNSIFESGQKIKVDIKSGNPSSGELYVYDYLSPEIRSDSIPFIYLQKARIDSFPAEVEAGSVINIQGDHFTTLGIPLVYIETFGPLTIEKMTNELIEAIVPRLTLPGGCLKLSYGETEVIADEKINVSALNSYDFLRNAFAATWSVPKNLATPNVLPFNSDAREAEGLGSVIARESALLDDGFLHENVLVITSPNPEYLYLEGRFEDFYLPASWEMVFEVGFLSEASQTDGVKLSIYLETDNGHYFFLEGAYQVYGGALSEFVFSPSSDTRNKRGTLVIRAEPGSTSFDDRLAIAKAELNFTHVERGWTLLFGSDKTNVLTIPGIKGESHDSNMPGSRSFPAVWQDNNGIIWVFGGYGNDVNPRNGRLNDLWKYDGDQWTWVNGLFSTNGYSKFSKVPGEMTTPGGRYAAVYWKDREGTFWIFGGHGYHTGGRQRSLNDLWKYTEEEGWAMLGIDKNWKDNGAHGAYGELTPMVDEDGQDFPTRYWPLTRHFSAFWYDKGTESTENTGVLWLFGGFYDEPGLEFCISDLWKFDGENWHLVDGDATPNYVPDAQEKNRPSARRGASIWTDENRALWLFGGYGPVDQPSVHRSLNDLWKFDNGSWQQVMDNDFDLDDDFVATQGRPGPRAHAALWKDNDGTIWMFGGEGTNTDPGANAPLNDLWRFENGTWAYENGPVTMRDMGNVTVPKVPNPNSWPSARLGAATWVNPTGWLMMFGGKGYGESQKTGNKSLGRLQQLWQFSAD